jgi:uncharacterized membrane protein
VYESSPPIEEGISSGVSSLRERDLSDRLRESLLFLPLIMLIASVLLQWLARWIDTHVDTGWLGPFRMSPDAAVTLLATIAGATVTTAGVVFSLLVVSLQLASGQFSPRVLRTFRRDRIGQVLVGLLLSTFAFCVLSLGQLNTSAAHAPTATMAIAILLAFASILAIVGYLNRITRQQYVGRIMERIQAEAAELIADLPYGPRMGARRGVPVDPPAVPDAMPLTVTAHTDGWIQRIGNDAMIAAAPPGGVVRVETRVGAYVVRGEPLARIWPAPDRSDAAAAARRVGEATLIGAARAMQQDIDFALRQLNDIGLRALSPAVNDPTTAIEVVLRVSSVLRPLLRADLPARAQRDDAGRVLWTPYDLDHAGYVRHAFGQIRTYAATHPDVLLAIVRSLRMLRAAAVAYGRTEAVAALDGEHAATIAGAVRAGLGDADIAPLRIPEHGVQKTYPPP